MYQNHTVGVVVPAYDEAEFVGGVARELPSFVDRVYLVDDASTDDTWAAMRRGATARVGAESGGGSVVQVQAPDGYDSTPLADRLSEVEAVGHVRLLRHGENMGAGGAVKTGYLAALEDGVDVIATIDGDGQMDPRLLARLLAPVVDGRAGYAKGNRFAESNVVREMPPFRLFGNLLLTALTRVATGYWSLSDPQNGLTVASRSALLAADVPTLWEYYGYMNQLMARLHAAGVRVEDVPVPTTYGDEESGIDYLRYVQKVSWLLLVSLLARLRTEYGDARLTAVALGGAALVATAVRAAPTSPTADEEGAS